MGRKKKVKAISSKEVSDNEPENDGNDDEITEKKVSKTRNRGKSNVSYKKLVYADESSEEEDPNICPLCDDRNDPSNPNDKKNRMIGCDGCDKWFHWTCVGINQSNKPGKNDDWFCKKCTTKKPEAGEWKPEAEDAEKLEVLPLRDEAQPSKVKTLGQKKSYEYQDSTNRPKKGRPPGGKSKVNDAIKSGKESWITDSKTHKVQNNIPSSSSSILEEAQASNQFSEDSEVSENNVNLDKLSHLSGISLSKPTQEKSTSNFPKISSLPPGISVHSDSSKISSLPPGISVHKESPKISSLPPGITIHKESPKITRLPPGISVHKETSSDIPNLPDEISHHEDDPSKLPPGISLQIGTKSSLTKAEEISFLNDVEKEKSSPLLSPKIKLIKVNEENKSGSDVPERRERSKRDLSQSTAKIKATLSEDSISDDDLFGNRKIPFKKLKTIGEKEKQPVENNLNVSDEISNYEEKVTKKRGRPSKKSIDEAYSNELQNILREANGLRARTNSRNHSFDDDKKAESSEEHPNSGKTEEEKSIQESETVCKTEADEEEGSNKGTNSDETKLCDTWEPVKDASGKKGLSLITKTTDSKNRVSLVVKNLNFDSESSSAFNDSNEHSTSRLVVDDAVEGESESNLNAVEEDNDPNSKRLEESEAESSKGKSETDKKMDLSQASLTNIDEINELLGLPKEGHQINSQSDEAHIQNITNNLEASGASILNQNNMNFQLNSSNNLLRPVSSLLPNASFSHQLPQSIIQPPSAAPTINQSQHVTKNFLPHTPPTSMRLSSADSGLGSASSTPTSNSSQAPTSSSSAIEAPGVWDVFNKELENFADGDNDEGRQTGLKVLSPMKLNEKADESGGIQAPRTITLTNPTQHIQVQGINQTRIVVQNPAAGLAPRPGLPQVTSAYLSPLNNRLQTRPSMPQAIRISHPPQSFQSNGALPVLQPSSVPAGAGHTVPTLAQGVVMSHPPQINVSQNLIPTTMPGVPANAPTTPTPTANLVVPVAANQSPSPTVPGSPGVRPPMSPGVRQVRPVRGVIRVRGQVRPRMPMRPGAPSPRGVRPRGPPPPGMRPVRPGSPVRGGIRPGMRPRGPRPGGPRPMRLGQPGAVRPSQPGSPATRPVAPPVQPPPKPAAPAPIAKVEVVDLSDDDEPPPQPKAKSATLERLKTMGISISKQKAPELPQGVRLPPGISLGSAGSSSAPKRSSTSTYSSNGESSNKRVALDSNVATALASAVDSSEPKQRVEVNLTQKQMDALKALGLL